MERKKNFAHSIKQKLFNLSQKQSENFQIVLTKYALERILARISASRYQSDFVLKGAMLFEVWRGSDGVSHRATRDIDFLSFGSSDIADLVEIFREVCSIEIAEDGIEFVSDSIKGEESKRTKNTRAYASTLWRCVKKRACRSESTSDLVMS